MTPSQAFLDSQVPELIQFIMDNSLNKVYEQYYLVYNVSEIDYQIITSIYVSIGTGVITALALKYAGTGNAAVADLIFKHINKLKNLKVTKCEFANDPSNKNCMDQY